jgi:dihydropteroate synthase
MQALRCGDRTLEVGRRTYVMGILNITPDSFSDGGRFSRPAAAYDHAQRLLRDGADIIDLGAESTRPGATPIGVEEELARLLPVVERLVAAGVRNLSIDTMKPEVAAAALRLGASWINDVSGLADPQLGPAVAAGGADGLVVMHSRAMAAGRIEDDVRYHDLITDVRLRLAELCARAEAAGVPAERIVVDPGIGFGKTVQDNLTLLERVHELHLLGRPVLVGPSRKRFLAALGDRAGLAALRSDGGHPGADPAAPGGEDRQRRIDVDSTMRDAATIGACCLAAWRGAHIVRVHDVAGARAALAVVDAAIR